MSHEVVCQLNEDLKEYFTKNLSFEDKTAFKDGCKKFSKMSTERNSTSSESV